MDAYLQMYFASFMEDGGGNPIWSDPQNALMDAVSLTLFYAWYGLFMIHYSYPFYKMTDRLNKNFPHYGASSYTYDTPLGYDSDTGKSGDPLFTMTDSIAT